MKVAKSAKLEKAQVQDLLTAVFTLCSLEPSLTQPVLDPLIAKARIAARRKVARMQPHRQVLVDFDVLGHVIYIWQRTPNYLDNEGQPIAVPASGPAPSIQALFRRIKRSSYFEQGLKHLLQVGRIRRIKNGRYLPCSEVSIVNKLTPEMVRLLSQTINWLVKTVLHNTAQRDPRAVRLIERVTTVPDLPSRQVRAFKIFAREQGGALINTVNEWLESRRGGSKARLVRPTSNQTAGLHVFAFVEKNRR